jgi:peptide chain release factor 1
LLAVYTKYAQSKGLKSELLDCSEGHAILQVTGKDAWETFRNESGGHVVQRVPPTESKGRRHTSQISVAVLPVKDQGDYPALKKEDLHVEAVRGQGPGGQHRNMTSSAIRMVHQPTKLQVWIDGRSQSQNKQEALRILTARVHNHLKAQRDGAYNAHRKNQLGTGGRGGKTRTYNFIESRVTDHRLKKKTRQIKEVMKGRLDLILE